MFWWYVLPLGFLLTQYTITGFDASAHISEETHDAAMSAPRGVWQSVFYSAVIGYVVLLAITFAASDATAVNEGGGTVFAVFESAMTTAWTKTILIICVHRAGLLRHELHDQRLAHDVRVQPRRRGARARASGAASTSKRIPFNAVMAVAVFALILTLPALKGNKDGVTVAFTAVVSIGVIGLYVCWADPDLPALARWATRSSAGRGPSATSTSGWPRSRCSRS